MPEGGPYGIRVNTLSMGMVTGTRFIDALHPDMKEAELARAPLGRLVDVADVVEAASFLLSDCPTMTGETVNVAAGIHALLTVVRYAYSVLRGRSKPSWATVASSAPSL